MLETAVVGAGLVADWHHDSIEACDRATTVAVCDVDADAARETAAEWGVDAYTDLGALLADGVDWVHVCTPVQTHREIAVECLAAGVPVLVEKPMTLTREGFEDVRRAADEAGVRATVVHNQAYAPPFVRARRLLDAGAYGDLRGVSVRWSEALDPREPGRGDWVLDLPGGEFGEGVVHSVYCGMRAGGVPVDDDALAVRRLDRMGDDRVGFDGVAVEYETADDVSVQVQHHARSADGRQLELLCADGRLTVDFDTLTLHTDRPAPDEGRFGTLVGATRRHARNALASARTTARVGARRLRAALLRERYFPRDTHTTVVALEARAVETGAPGPTPSAEADWANRVFARL